MKEEERTGKPERARTPPERKGDQAARKHSHESWVPESTSPGQCGSTASGGGKGSEEQKLPPWKGLRPAERLKCGGRKANATKGECTPKMIPEAQRDGWKRKETEKTMHWNVCPGDCGVVSEREGPPRLQHWNCTPKWKGRQKACSVDRGRRTRDPKAGEDPQQKPKQFKRQQVVANEPATRTNARRN